MRAHRRGIPYDTVQDDGSVAAHPGRCLMDKEIREIVAAQTAMQKRLNRLQIGMIFGFVLLAVWAQWPAVYFLVGLVRVWFGW